MKKYLIYANLLREPPLKRFFWYLSIFLTVFVFSTEWIISGNIEKKAKDQNRRDISPEVEGINQKTGKNGDRIPSNSGKDGELSLGPDPRHNRVIDRKSIQDISIPNDKKPKPERANSKGKENKSEPKFSQTNEIPLNKNALPCELIIDMEVKKTPVVPRPEYLDSYIDPIFGTKVTRITNPGNPIPKIGKVWKDIARHRYSLDQAWNSNQSLLILDRAVKGGGKIFLDGNTYKPLFFRKPPGYEDRWHPTKPDLRIFVKRNQIGTWNVRTRNVTIIDSVDKYTHFKFGPGKGNPSQDGSRIGLLAKDPKGRQVAFAYDLEKKHKYPDIILDDLKVKCWVSISPLGNYLFVHEKRIDCSQVYDLEGKKVGPHWTEKGRPSHFDLAVDENGDEVAVGVSKSKPDKGRVIKRRLSDGKVTVLTPGGWASHTSARNLRRPGWVYATYTRRKPNKKRWLPYSDEIIAVKLDGSMEVQRLGHTHAAKNGYATEQHGSPSLDGKRVIFASNWDDPDGNVAAYVIEICPEMKK